MNITAFDLAQRFVGMKEVAGTASNPAILAMLRLDDAWPQGDEVPWCSAFVNYICWLLRLPRSKRLNARSWLDIGFQPEIPEAANDVAIFSRLEAGPLAGHVGFVAGWSGTTIRVLGGNQSNSVSIAEFPMSRLLGIRRLA